jgi:hypothetical protein
VTAASTEEEDKGQVGCTIGPKAKQAGRHDGPSWPGGPGKWFSGRNQQKNMIAAEMLFKLIQGFDFKIKGFKYF